MPRAISLLRRAKPEPRTWWGSQKETDTLYKYTWTRVRCGGALFHQSLQERKGFPLSRFFDVEKRISVLANLFGAPFNAVLQLSQQRLHKRLTSLTEAIAILLFDWIQKGVDLRAFIDHV